MNWQNLSEFLAMGGYARYVWGAVVVFFLALLLEIVSLSLRKQALLRELRLEQQSLAAEKGEPS